VYETFGNAGADTLEAGTRQPEEYARNLVRRNPSVAESAVVRSATTNNYEETGLLVSLLTSTEKQTGRSLNEFH